MFCELFKCKRNLFSKESKVSDTLRIVYINGHKPDFYSGPERYKYPNNTVKTSKYTIFNFLFKNLFQQFRRIANFYFLLVIIVRVSIIIRTLVVSQELINY
jgi:phospholipid-translocating ATPase